MWYLLSSGEEDFKAKMDVVKSKILTSGYISTSLSKELDSIADFRGFCECLMNKSGKILNFFGGCNSLWLDDILFEYFEDRYNLNFDWGLWDGTKYRSVDKKFGGLDSITNPNLVKDEKVKLLMVNIIDFLFEKTLDSFKEYGENRDSFQNSYSHNRTKKADFWGHSKKSKPSVKDVSNYFKLIMNVQPSVVFTISHRDLIKHWNENVEITDGLRYSDIYPLSDLITKRLYHFKVKFGNFHPYSTEIAAPSFFTDDYSFQKNFLLKTNMNIKFTDLNNLNYFGNKFFK